MITLQKKKAENNPPPSSFSIIITGMIRDVSLVSEWVHYCQVNEETLPVLISRVCLPFSSAVKEDNSFCISKIF